MFQVKWALAVVAVILVAANATNLDDLTAEQLIVQGQNAKRGQFPFYVFLEIKIPQGLAGCGGSLISNQWIVTAAHCLYTAESANVHLGSLKVRDVTEKGRKTVTVYPENFYVHPKFFILLVLNDIALIKLPEPVEFSDVIKPISLACSSSSGADVVAIGNGLTRDTDKTLPDILQYAELKTISALRCKWEFPFLLFRKSVICSKGEEKRSVCHGDSGGPLATADGSALIGLTSFGSRKGCEQGKPQAFTRVSSYLEWIEETTGVGCKN